jgi:hypothetical protein
MKKIVLLLLIAAGLMISIKSFAYDDMSWSPRTFAGGRTADLGDQLSVATAIRNKGRSIYSSYTYVYNDSHSEKNVSIVSENNQISQASKSAAVSADSADKEEELYSEGGKISWLWEWK